LEHQRLAGGSGGKAKGIAPMELTTRGRYAVMAMADLALHSAEGPVALAAIAERQRLSLAYLEQLFQRLRQAGLVVSVRGRSGGYRLARPAEAIHVLEILGAVSEGTRMTRCRGEGEAGCLGEDRCLTHHLWSVLGAHIASFLARVSLADVLSGEGLSSAADARPIERMAAE
jgi:Rrf2 family protein